MKICASCDKPMRDDEARTVSKTSASGAGTNLYFHKVPCEPKPHQGTPVRRR
ncbi:hypothetical protein OG848_08285 [Streptomyces canus]|uniref:hypothetical protein n=1 Tax=Streptomyces canus TaxID=58343 RepID=UPI00324990E9